ncbi:cytochrome c biogenesis protein DipZ [Boudabousia marimammalium]|uniref:Cytochrome C biogenesis protein n=1 Tax=Boudabousia marimammalium TaxID=156892 RepID=A0A1Q5PSI6_9ACTO|nr:cytochrome c biogenesis protein DipZ [Boudabousia marimammalium]OKL50541.1 cytochrome C biogenesis protein [Boudabousia marimammalium]
MLIIALLSLLAGMLSALAPCVLPFLPIIVGGSLDNKGGWKRPLIVSASLVTSLLVFTVLLKASTLLIDIDPGVWPFISGILVIILGFVMLFPSLWARVMTWTKLGNKSHEMLDNARSKNNGTWSAILTGAALGPVFSSCSPTYAWVIATVLPAEPAVGLFYLAMYCIGLAIVLLAIAMLGRALITKLGWLANPYGWFQRALAILFILVGISIVTGVDKKIQTWAVDWAPSITQLEESLIPDSDNGAGAEESPAGELLPAGTQAPELAGLQEWINSNPTTLEQLKGKVVLIDFWTYSCINCQRTQPYLNAWYDNYHDKGFEIIGVHAPEFAFEKVPANVENAVQEAGIKYPVALDNNFTTWRAFNNRYWPAKYLIDKNGDIRYTHFGEGDYEQTESAIQQLLNVDAPSAKPQGMVETSSEKQSPETYLGVNRARGFVGTPHLQAGLNTYQPAESITQNEWTLGGDWEVDGEKITAKSAGATLSYRFTGKKMFLVMGAEGVPAGASSQVKVMVDGISQPGGMDVKDGQVKVQDYRLYRLVELPEITEGTQVTLTFDKGVSANAFTFG